MTTVLAIDTASDAFALALAVEGAIVASHVQEPGRDHSAQLVPSIEALLGEHRDSLDAVVVVTGPGSYAGLRAGIACAQGLGFAKNIPVVGVATLAAVQRASGMTVGTVAHPAGRGTFAHQEVRDGTLTGLLNMTPGSELRVSPLAGEGTGTMALGGAELGPGERVRAALELGLERLADGGEVVAVDAIYLREPHITVSRRIQTAQALGG